MHSWYYDIQFCLDQLLTLILFHKNIDIGGNSVPVRNSLRSSIRAKTVVLNCLISFTTYLICDPEKVAIGYLTYKMEIITLLCQSAFIMMKLVNIYYVKHLKTVLHSKHYISETVILLLYNILKSSFYFRSTILTPMHFDV